MKIELSEKEIRRASTWSGIFVGAVLATASMVFVDYANSVMKSSGYGWYLATIFGGIMVLYALGLPFLVWLDKKLYKAEIENAEYKHLKRGK